MLANYLTFNNAAETSEHENTFFGKKLLTLNTNGTSGRVVPFWIACPADVGSHVCWRDPLNLEIIVTSTFVNYIHSTAILERGNKETNLAIRCCICSSTW